MLSAIVSRLVILVFGTLYPAYASYKAVRGKDVKEYVKWMMYWIVFALFTSAETFTDVFLGFWFPFYYEVKVILVFWLLSPMTKGSSFLYRKFVHPMLSRREQDIDDYIARAKDQGYSTVLSLGSKGVNYATNVFMQTAIKGGGGLVNQLRRSYSLSDISVGMDEISRAAARSNADQDRTDSTGNTEGRVPRQRSHTSQPGMEMYFPEVDVNVRQRGSREPSVPLSQIRSTEDVSSGYSSAEPLYARPAAEEALVRTSSVGSTRVTRTRSTRAGTTPVAKTRAAPTEDSTSFDDCEESDSDDLDDEFYDVVTSTSPVINVKPISYTVKMHEATLATPLTKEAAIEKILSPTLKTFSDSLLEMYLGNVRDEGEEVLVVEKEEEVVVSMKEVILKPVEMQATEEKLDVPCDVTISDIGEKLESSVVNAVVEEIKPAKLEENEGKSVEIEYKLELSSQIESPPLCLDKIETADQSSVETPRENSDDAEFFDTESASPLIETSAGREPTEPKAAEAKVDRAGKYHKRPAPCPPKRVDGDSLSPDGDDISFRSADSRGSPSPRLEVAACDLPESVDDAQKKSEVEDEEPSNSATATFSSPKTTKKPAPGPVPGLKPKAEAPPPSPTQQKKPKESPMSRLLAKFFSHEGSSRGLVATSLTNITGEIEAELRSASSLTFLGVDKPPKLPPKPQKKDFKEEPKERSPAEFRIRDMSHSPPRRKSDI